MLAHADKEVRNAADTCVARNAERALVRWTRVPQGTVTCPWCIMLASRGAVYGDAEKAAAGHANCDCRVVPDFGGGIEGYDREYYLDCYEHPENHPEVKDAVNARRRELRHARKVADSLLVDQRQFGSKMGRHVRDFGYTSADLGKSSVRDELTDSFRSIISKHDEFLSTPWNNQDGMCEAYVKDGLVVLVNNGVFVTAFKEVLGGNTRLDIARAEKWGSHD